MKYFDYASTTPVNDEVLNTYSQVLNKYFENSESIYPAGVEVNNLMEKSRSQIASLLGCLNKEVIFTGSGSEANNMAIKGVALQKASLGKHIITSCVEHSSIMNSCEWLKTYLGYEITYLPVNQEGKVDVEDLKKCLREDTILVSVMAVNNESGAIMPINEIKKEVKKYRNAYFHVDFVQALGKHPIDLSDIDLASFSAHKINGLKGSGFLVKKQHVQIAPLISGGQQENHLRGGTANTPANIVLAKTLRLALNAQASGYVDVCRKHDYLYNKLQNLDKVVINSPKDGTPFLINFSCLTITSQVMMNALALKGFEVSAQSTCDSNDAYSRVIKQMYKDENRLKGTIRISISYTTSLEDIDELLQAIKETIKTYG